MAIRVVAVGKLAKGRFREAADDYLKRIARYIPIEVAEVAEERLSKRGVDEVRRAEDERILAAIPKSHHVILTDARGKRFTSEQFARMIEHLLLSGKSNITFVVGGTLGVGEKVRTRADETVSFSQMTLAHQLARVVLLEQVYRAFTIMRGEKYHH